MRSKSGTLAVVCLATAMLMLDIAVVNTALPRVARDLDAGLGGLQWIVDAYTLALAAIVLTAGSIADRIGRRKVFAAGMGLFTAASLACAVSWNIVALDVARAVQGVGGAVLFATSLALLADAFPSMAERGKALAVYGATIGASFAVGPLVGGLLTSGLGWRSVFYINVPLGIAAIPATFAWVKESRDPRATGVDWAGLTTLTGGLFLLVFALLRGNEDGWSSVTIVGSLTAAAALLGAFAVSQVKVASPMLPLGTFRNRAFSGAQVAAFAISGSFFAVFVYTTLYLQEILHLSAVEAGAVYLPATIAVFVVSAISAQLTARVGAGVLIVTGLVLVSAGMALMTLAGATSSWAALIPGLVVGGVGTGLFNPAVSAVALGSLPGEQSGLAAGANDTFRQAGIAVGVAAFGALVPGAAALGHGSAVAYVDGLHTALIVGAGLALAGAVVSAYLLGVRRPAQAVEAAPELELAA